MEPLVSVIMAAYNAERTIGAAIRSILGQTYENLELIIVDDASRDRTVEIIRSFSDDRIILLFNEVNSKLGMSLNKAIDKARGAYIARQDADDISMKTRLEKQINFMMSHPEIDVLGSNAYLYDLSGIIIGCLMKKGNNHNELTAKILSNVPLIHATVMAKISWYQKYRYRKYPYSEDRDLWLRSYRYSIFYNLPECLYAIRDPGRISIRKLILSSWTNLVMRLQHHREYGLSAASVLAYPLLLGGRWLYWGIQALRGKSLFDLPRQRIPDDEQFRRDQDWIYQCLNASP